MMLSAAAALGVLSMVLFLGGLLVDRPELAMFGAIIMIGVGASGAVDGINVKTGEVEVTNETANETYVNGTFEDVETHTGFPLDIVLLLLGAVMLIGGAGEASEADQRRQFPFNKE